MVYMEQIHVGILSLVRSWAARDLPALLSDTVSWELVELIERCLKAVRQAGRQAVVFRSAEKSEMSPALSELGSSRNRGRPTKESDPLVKDRTIAVFLHFDQPAYHGDRARALSGLLRCLAKHDQGGGGLTFFFLKKPQACLALP